MEFFIALLYVIALIAGFWIWVTVAGLRETIKQLQDELDRRSEAVRRLTARVFQLEQGEVQAPEPVRQAEPVPEPIPVSPVEEVPSPVYAPEPAPVRAEQDTEWEARIGGSWLNKLGVLILVIGIALFLGYSLTNLGAAGRVSVGYAISFSMLLAGVALERQEIYRVYGRGLIGGGWAALYCTTYAVHALPAARLIDSQPVGFALLIVVAIAMLAHSLRYRSQAVTGLAFFVAFFTLTLWPHISYAVAAAIPLAAALLVIAYLFSWMPMAVIGVILSYGAYAIIYNPTPPEFLGAYPTLWVFWILFESFDLLDLRRNTERNDVAQLMMTLNFVGLFGVALLTGAKTDIFPLAAGVLYAVSTAARSRYAEGRYQVSAAISACLLIWASYTRFHGFETNVFQLAVAETAILAGVFSGRRYLIHLGSVVFALPVLKLVFQDAYRPDWTLTASLQAVLAVGNAWLCRPNAVFPSAATLTVAAMMYHLMPTDYVAPAWAGLGLILLAADLRLNLRGLRHHAYALSLLAFVWMCSGNRPLSPTLLVLACIYASQVLTPRGEIARRAFAALGSILATLLIMSQVKDIYIAPACAALGLTLLVLDLHFSEQGLRYHNYALAAVSVLAIAIVNAGHTTERILPVAIVAGCFYAAQFLNPREDLMRPVFSVMGTFTLTLLLFWEVSGKMLTIACGFEGIALLAAGFLVLERVLRLSGLTMFFFCIGKLFFWDLSALDTLNRIFSFIILGLLLLGASWAYTRFREQIRRFL